MHSPQSVRVVTMISVLLWAAGASAQQPDLEQARDLYDTARFDEALEILDSPPATLPESERPEWAELRAVVLFALRSNEYGDALMDLAMLAPNHRLSAGLPPEIYTAFEMARAHLRDPVEANLARARALYFVADFGGALEVLEAMHEPALTHQQRVDRTVLRSLALFALQRVNDCRDALKDLARLAGTYRFDRRVPPRFKNLWHEARAGHALPRG